MLSFSTIEMQGNLNRCVIQLQWTKILHKKLLTFNDIMLILVTHIPLSQHNWSWTKIVACNYRSSNISAEISNCQLAWVELWWLDRYAWLLKWGGIEGRFLGSRLARCLCPICGNNFCKQGIIISKGIYLRIEFCHNSCILHTRNRRVAQPIWNLLSLQHSTCSALISKWKWSNHNRVIKRVFIHFVHRLTSVVVTWRITDKKFATIIPANTHHSFDI